MTRTILTALTLLAAASTARAQDASGYAWTHVVEPDAHYLTLAVPESDDVGMQFRCTRTGPVSLISYGLYTGEGPEPRWVTIASGRVRATSPLRLELNEETGGGYVAQLPRASPVLTAFARSVALTLSANTVELDGNAPTAVERAAVAAFVNACRGR